jgi:[ribosomal protein S5]-alanine N-acetyltransferase
VRVHGPRLTLRYPELTDAPVLFGLGRDATVTRFFSWGPYQRVEQAQAYIAALRGRRAAGNLLDLAIVDPDAGLIGITGLSSLSVRDRRAVVGTWLGRPFWGTGRNAESKALVAALAFAHLGLERLGAYASTGNARSQAALERLGFRREGVLRAFHRHGDAVHDVVSFSLLRDGWEASEMRDVPVRVTGEPPEPWKVVR